MALKSNQMWCHLHPDHCFSESVLACAGQAQPGGIAGGNLGGQAQQNPQGTNPVQQDSSFGRASMETPGVVQDSTKRDIENGKAAREKLEQERLHAWRSKHKVDAAGFV